MRVWAMAQTSCVILTCGDRKRLAAIIADRNRPQKHVQRARIIATLNAWREAMIGPAEQHRGEVLKVIGDAVLAIFPISDQRPREQACANAFAAGEQFASAWHERRSGIDFTLALHFGEVAYGNVGAPRRLDFTVIGPAVNRAARLQELAKTLGYSVVTTSALASSLPHGRIQDLGWHKLRDIEKL